MLVAHPAAAERAEVLVGEPEEVQAEAIKV